MSTENIVILDPKLKSVMTPFMSTAAIIVIVFHFTTTICARIVLSYFEREGKEMTHFQNVIAKRIYFGVILSSILFVMFIGFFISRILGLRGHFISVIVNVILYPLIFSAVACCFAIAAFLMILPKDKSIENMESLNVFNIIASFSAIIISCTRLSIHIHDVVNGSIKTRTKTQEGEEKQKNHGLMEVGDQDIL